jgi:hypothetical protein
MVNSWLRTCPKAYLEGRTAGDPAILRWLVLIDCSACSFPIRRLVIRFTIRGIFFQDRSFHGDPEQGAVS